MSCTAKKIDSNITGLRYAIEECLGALPASPVWYPLEPNSYSDFGGQLTLVARNPINPSRQRKKGVITDLDASGGFNTDVTQTNLQDILQGFFFASYRAKSDSTLAGAVLKTITGTNTYNYGYSKVASTAVTAGGTGYTVGDVLTFVGGTFTTAAQVTVLTAPGGVIGTVSVTQVGLYATQPSSPVSVTGGTGTGATFTPTWTNNLGFTGGDILFASGFANTANNGKKNVASVGAGSVTVSETLVNDASPAFGAKIARAGVKAGSGVFAISATGGAYPTLTSSTLDLTTLGLTPGEWVFIGGDSAALAFTNAENNGFKRIRSITAGVLTFDKTTTAMTTEAGGAKTIELYFGRVLKNEADPDLIIRRSYQLERTLGVPQGGTSEQSEYIIGAVPNELTFNFATADKITADLAFVGIDNEQRTSATGVKSGARPALVEADAFNTSSDFSRIKLSLVSATDPAPVPLFGFVTDMTVTVNNTISANKAIGTLGAFDTTAGTFTVNGDITAYFADVTAMQAVRNNSDVSLDMVIVKNGAGIVIDVPLIALGDGRLTVEQDQPIKLPLSMDAATAAKIDPNLDYTLLMGFFEYLPGLASA